VPTCPVTRQIRHLKAQAERIVFYLVDSHSRYYLDYVFVEPASIKIMILRMWRFLFLAGLLSLLWGKSVPAKQQPEQVISGFSAGHLSEPYRNVWCSAVTRLDPHKPTWANGHLAQLADEHFPVDLIVFDGECKQLSSAHVAIPGWTVTVLIAAVPAIEVDAIVSGGATTNPGLTFFLAQISSGGVVSVIRTEGFMARGVCEASDHTIWTIGRDGEKEKAHEDYPLVQQYSAEKGFLHGYLSRAESGLTKTTLLGASSIYGALLVCGKKHISVYLNETNEYIEIDPSTESLRRWKMDTRPLPKGQVDGFAVTEKGRIYASIFEDWRTETDWKFRRGLFELRLDPNSGLGTWGVIGGTLSSYDPEDVPNVFFKLWGADSEDLVIRRLNDAYMSWVRVIP